MLTTSKALCRKSGLSPDWEDGYLHKGGLVQNGSITERNFLEMLGIVLVSDAPIHVQHLRCWRLGIYMEVNDEPWIQRDIYRSMYSIWPK